MRRLIIPALVLGAVAGCSPNDPPAAQLVADSTTLVAGEWTLVELEGQPTPLGAGDRAPTLLLADTASRATGFGGCNRYAGRYSVAGDSLRFSQLAMTRMGCDKGNELEVRYTGLLERVRQYRIVDQRLELLAGDSVVARYVRLTPS